MRSTPTPHVAVGRTTEDISMSWGAGRLKYPITIPKGTRCKKLEGGSEPWVVDDLSFIDRRHTPLLHHDAYYYGIRIDPAKIEETS